MKAPLCRKQCLLRFTRCPMDVQTSSNPLRSGAGKLPYLQIGNQKFAGYRQIKRVLDLEVSEQNNAGVNKLQALFIDMCFFMGLIRRIILSGLPDRCAFKH